MNDSDDQFIAEEEISQAASTQGTSLSTPEANLHVVLADKQSKKKKNQKRRNMKLDQKSKHFLARRASPRARNAIQSKWNSFPNRNIFFGDRSQRAARIDSWTIKSLCLWNGRNLTVSKEEPKVFLGINFDMTINKLPMIAWYWRVDNLISNEDIQNSMTRNRFCDILQNLHFADNRKDFETGKVFKMRPVIGHLNSKFPEVLLNNREQSIDEHMVKFKGRSGMKQYIISKPIKLGFKLCFHCSSKSDYLYQMDIYLGRKETSECNLGLGREVVLQLTKNLERLFCTVYLYIFLIVQS